MRKSLRDADLFWLLGGLAWGGMSLVVLLEYRRIGGGARELNELWLLLSMFWGQFGFAAMFNDWRKNRGRNFRGILLRTVLPPLILHLLAFMGM